MAKRSTIGDNPLDAVVPAPAASPKQPRTGAAKTKPSWQRPARSPRRSQAAAQAFPADDKGTLPEGKPEPVVTAAAPPSGEAALLTRVEALEQENQCMKWLVGAVLAPLALLALLL